MKIDEEGGDGQALHFLSFKDSGFAMLALIKGGVVATNADLSGLEV